MTDKNGESSYRRIVDGDVAALENLVKAYGDGLVRFAYCYVKDSATAEDIMEDSFAALLVKRKRFQDGENLRAYLYKIVRNKCVDYLRFHKRHRPLEDYERVLTFTDMEREIADKERNKTLYGCMQALPEQYAQILYLVYFEGYGVADVCGILKKSKKQVYNLLARAKNTLKEGLAKEGIFYENI